MDTVAPTAAQHLPFSGGDPLTAFFARRVNINPFLAAVVIVLLINLPIVVMAFIFNLWQTTGANAGLLDDFTWWLLQFTSVLATVAFFLWLPRGVPRILEGLKANNVIVLSPPEGDNAFAAFENRFDASYSRPLWLVLCLILTIVVMTVFVIPLHRTYQTWGQRNPFIFVYTEVLWFFFFLLGWLNIIRVFVVTVWFNRLFQNFSVDLKVLHPDGAGGLGPLGKFSVNVAYVIAAYGIALVVILFAASYHVNGQFGAVTLTPGLFVLTLAYLSIAPLAFFAPIGSAHTAMETAKRAALLQISRQFESDFARMQALLASDSDELKKIMEKIEHLEQIHALTARFPVWPFNTGNLVRFFSVISSPLLLWLISNIIAFLPRK